MADERIALEDIKSATILKPGDRVLLVVAGNWTNERVEFAHRLLGDRFPDVVFSFVSHVEEVLVKSTPPQCEHVEVRTDG